MLATTINALNIPPLCYPVIQQIQAATEPPTPNYLDRLCKGFNYRLGTSSTVTTESAELLRIEQLGWSTVEALETHLRFRNFAEDWDAPGMEVYDAPLVQRDPVIETFQPKTELGKRLLALRRAYVEKGGPLLDAEGFDRELQRRRGGVSDE
jgi:hypothetical protein